jgi:phage terminase large subunit-like protein
LRLDQWDRGNTAIDIESLKGRTCYAGLDLAQNIDPAAFVLVFPNDDEFILLPFFWVPADNAEIRERRDRVPYLTWARQGLMEMTAGTRIDYTVIRSRIKELAELYDIQEIAYDPYNATQFAEQLFKEDGLRMLEFRQGALSFNEPLKRFEALVATGRMRHGGNPVLRWMAGNIEVIEDEKANLRPFKPKNYNKIDGIVAAVMGLARAISTDNRQPNYPKRGMLSV